MSDTTAGVADLRPLDRAKEQKAWYWYDWANSAYVTTIAAVLFAPYLTSVAEAAACGKASQRRLRLRRTDLQRPRPRHLRRLAGRSTSSPRRRSSPR